MYERLRGARVSLQLADLGHPRGSNKAKSDRFFEVQGARFFDAYLKDSGRPPAHRSVTAFTQTCPSGAPDGGPFRARSWAALHPDSLTARARGRQRVTSGGGNPDTAKAYDQVLSADACRTVPRERAGGTAIAQTRVRRPFTLLGLPTVRASIDTRGRGGMLAARLWDVHRGRQLLVARGVLRLEDGQDGRIVFQLFGNGWRFGRGHVAKLELLGSDPGFLAPSNFRFSARLSRLSVKLPGRGG